MQSQQFRRPFGRRPCTSLSDFNFSRRWNSCAAERQGHGARFDFRANAPERMGRDGALNVCREKERKGSKKI